MLQFLLFDLDDTILDFHAAERIALGRTLTSFGLEPTEDVRQKYHNINIRHWQALERGEETREQVTVWRFRDLFREFRIQADPEAVCHCYENNLGIGHIFLPGALETIRLLAEHYQLYLVSNGTASVQRSRLASAELYPYFQDIFISEEIGWNKPSREYFDVCFARIPSFDPAKAMIIGDSLTSDILGGIRAGIMTCLVDPSGSVSSPDIVPDHTIGSIAQLPALLSSLTTPAGSQEVTTHG